MARKPVYSELEMYKKEEFEPERSIGGMSPVKAPPRSILSKLNYYNCANDIADEKYKKKD